MTLDVYSLCRWLPLLLIALPSTVTAQPAAERLALVQRLVDARHAVVATVLDVRPSMRSNDFGDEIIVSELALHVGEVLRGGTPATMSIEVEGGTLDGITMKVSDTPQMNRGDRAVFLLRGGPPGRFRLADRGHSILLLDDEDGIRGTGLRLQDVRELVAEVQR